MLRTRSFEYRICLLFVALLFGLFFVTGHLEVNSQRSAIIQEKTERYHSLTKMLALMHNSFLRNEDPSIYQALTASFMSKETDVSHVTIYDSKGNTIFSNVRPPRSPQKQGFIDSQAHRIRKWLRQTEETGNAQSIEVEAPIMIGQWEQGKISIGYVPVSMAEAIGELETRVVCILVTAFLAGIFGCVLLSKAVTMPLKRLISATRAVELGNLEVSVPVDSSDELGELSDAFNKMVVGLKDSTDKLIERANTDSLTELFNHRYFQERLRSEIRRAERYERPLSVIMLDIDHFKTLNDTHGHPVGDSVLRDTARILEGEGRRDIDVITRYGGEEFALIVPETELEGAMIVAERIRLAIQRHAFLGKGGETIPVTVSLGVAQFPIHSSEPEGLIMAADLAMYQSKSMGRNMTTAFSSDTRTERDRDPYRLYLLLHASDMSTIEAMAAAVDTKSQRPSGFSKSVVTHSVKLAVALGLSEAEQKDIRLATLLHDIGKLGISEEILNKKEPLTQEEMNVIKSHPNLGYSVVQKSAHLRSMLPGILSHHEWWNGEGYPDGLKGEDIPLIARTISIVDAYHAMLTDRPHCGAKTVEEARAELRRCAGVQFDPHIVEVFLRILQDEDAESGCKAA